MINNKLRPSPNSILIRSHLCSGTCELKELQRRADCKASIPWRSSDRTFGYIFMGRIGVCVCVYMWMCAYVTG